MSLFKERLSNEQDWENIFQSAAVFAPLVEHILDIEKLASARIENLTPGTNAVFKVGEYVIKIFAPVESRVEQRLPQTEIFATRRANELGISAPTVIAHGLVEDKYHFAYLITEYIECKFAETYKNMTEEGKMLIGRKLRVITDKMNTPCELFNDIVVVNGRGRDCSWDKYPKLQKERLAYIKSHNYGENVLVHSDLCGDNILLTPKDELYIIDFADAVIAPKVYEHALLAVESELDPMILRGYFEDYTVDEFLEMCFNGLLLVDDSEILEDLLGKPNDFKTLDDLRKSLKRNVRII